MLPPRAEIERTLAVNSAWLALWADFVANQCAWWWCVLATRAGSPWALVGPLLYLTAQLVIRRGERVRIAGLAAAGALTGLLGDFLLVRAALLAFPPVFGAVAPFMLALWAMFAVSLTASAALLSHSPAWRAALFGAVAGPLAYAAGARLSVLSLRDGAAWAVALEWLLAVPWLAYCARRSERGARA